MAKKKSNKSKRDDDLFSQLRKQGVRKSAADQISKVMIEARDPLTLEGWIAFVADRFFDDVRLQTYLAAVVRNPAVLDPPQFALAWIRSLPVPWSSLWYDPVFHRWWFPEDFLDSDGTVSIG